MELAVVKCFCNSPTEEAKTGYQKFKIIFDYLGNSKLAWAT